MNVATGTLSAEWEFMKLATLTSQERPRDGRLVVVSRDLTRCTSAELIAPTLQAALDNWGKCLTDLEALAAGLEIGSVPAERFHERDCMSPLPRAYQWLDGSAYVNHVQLLRQSRGAELPDRFWTDPLMYQGCSDPLLAPRDDIVMPDESWGIDFEGEVAVVTDAVPLGADKEIAAKAIRLVMLCNDVSLRNIIPDELSKGFGFVHGKPPSAFSPVAVTPDELGDAWQDAKVHLPMLAYLNGDAFGCPNAGIDMTFDFASLVAHAAKTRPLAAGTIVGSGTVSNRDPSGGPGLPVSEGGIGYTCIAEQRTVETIRHGEATTPFLTFGDVVRLEMKDTGGQSVFGAIEQKLTKVERG